MLPNHDKALVEVHRLRFLPLGACQEEAAGLRQILDATRTPKGPCTQIVYTLAPKYLNRGYFKAKVYTIWVHGPLGHSIEDYRLE